MRNTTFYLLLATLSLLSSATFADDLLNGCKIHPWTDKEDNENDYQVISNGRTVYWQKTAESGGANNYTNEGNRELGDRDGMISPVTVDGVLSENQTSQAVYACEKNGRHLPTWEDFQALRNCFDKKKSDSRYLSSDGLKKLYSYFPDMEGRSFWSSSVHPNRSYAFYFNGADGYGDYYNRYYQYSVRCVSR